MSSFRRSPIPSALRSSPIAEALPAAELRQLSQLSTVIDVPQGKRIIAESTPGRECFIVLDGQFDVSTNATNLHAKIQAGEIAGELALLTGRPRSASVVASRDASVCAMHPREFATLLSQAHRFRSRVLTSAYQRLDNTESITLPAQFVRRSQTSGQPQKAWSDRLGEIPAWRHH